MREAFQNDADLLPSAELAASNMIDIPNEALVFSLLASHFSNPSDIFLNQGTVLTGKLLCFFQRAGAGHQESIDLSHENLPISPTIYIKTRMLLKTSEGIVSSVF